MKIEQSSVVLNAAHAFSCERQLDYESTASFRQVYTGVQNADASTAATSERERLQLLIQRLTQGLIDLLFSGAAGANPVDVREILSTDGATPGGTAETDPAAAKSGRGVLCFDWTTRITETVREHESMQFSAKGTVRTADGRSLEFDLGLSLCRDYSCTREQVETGSFVLRDPLVLNFDGKACELSGKRFAFDLDMDSQSEQIPALASTSGFLALDRNQDGRVNDGGELFGAKTGDGFADLAAFDEDGNGWIDESDAVFDRLKIWRNDGEGHERLTGLREEGVGAIKLERVESAYKLTDAENNVQGRIRSSGLYLSEAGLAGSVQQVDLAV